MTPKDYIFSGLLLISLVFGTVQTVRLANAKMFHAEYVAEIKDKMTDTYRDLNQQRNATEAAVAAIGNKYFEGVEDANKLHDVTIDRLNADISGLQKHWRSALNRANTAEAKLASSSSDAEATAVSEDLAAFVRDSASGDATIVSLQDTLNTYLCQINKEPYPGYECISN